MEPDVSLPCVLFTKYYLGDQTKDKMEGACSAEVRKTCKEDVGLNGITILKLDLKNTGWNGLI
jgi:hypothetical protein